VGGACNFTPVSTEETIEATVAVRLIALLFEGAFLQLFQTVRADKVFRVKLAKHGRYAAPGNRLMTSSAERAPFGVVVSLTVRHPFVDEEGTALEQHVAVPTYEAIGMPLGG